MKEPPRIGVARERNRLQTGRGHHPRPVCVGPRPPLAGGKTAPRAKPLLLRVPVAGILPAGRIKQPAPQSDELFARNAARALLPVASDRVPAVLPPAFTRGDLSMASLTRPGLTVAACGRLQVIRRLPSHGGPLPQCFVMPASR